VFQPYSYPHDTGEDQRWWEFAPTGREMRAAKETPQ
jgi:hypothetical protein